MADGVVYEESVVLLALLGSLVVDLYGLVALITLVSHFILGLFEGLQSRLQIVCLLSVGFLFVIAWQSGQGGEVESALHFPKTASLLALVQIPERLL